MAEVKEKVYEIEENKMSCQDYKSIFRNKINDSVISY